MKEKQEVTFWATQERKPIVQSGSVKMSDGTEVKFNSKNEYKAWRKKMQKEIVALRKAGK